MTRAVAWDGLRFTVSTELVDQSVLQLVDKPDAPSLAVTVTQEPLGGGKPALLRYVDEQLRELAKAAPGFAVVSQGERKVGPLAGVHVQAVVAGGGKRKVQHQLYALDEGRGRVVVVNVTAHEGSAGLAAGAVEEIAGSFAVGSG